jgi:phosphomevalonate kinase
VPEKIRVYKLSAIAHYRAQGKIGSAFDIAAATFGGVITYKRFDAQWLEEQMKKYSLREIVNRRWPQFSAEAIDLPKGINFAAAWTGKDASTAGMVQKMNAFKEIDNKTYRNIYSNIGYVVEELADAIKSNDKDGIIKLINENHMLLSELTKKSKIEIETKELRKLHDIAGKYGAGKLSGAGGGDCGIGICFDKSNAEKMRRAWSANGLQVIDVSIDNDGVKLHA